MKHSENAVSSVIGVILMVAFTVILTATIAYFIFGAAQSGPKPEKLVGATAIQKNDGNINVLYLGGKNTNDCTSLTVTIAPEKGAPQTQTLHPSSGAVMPGSQVSFIGDFSGRDHIIMVAKFKDGSEKTIYENTL
jgi:flagellin-like protein